MQSKLCKRSEPLGSGWRSVLCGIGDISADETAVYFVSVFHALAAKVEKYNYKTTREAVRRTVVGSATAQEVVAGKNCQTWFGY